jgi:hypothetical protein
LEDLNVDGRITVKCFFKQYNGSVEWTDLAEDRDRWRALVNAVMNIRVP